MAVTVLIVDDDTMFVEMLTFALNLAGFVTRTAYEGLQALNILNSESIDVVVLDVMLPDMDGFDVCRQIRGNRKYGEVPILMLSARTRIADRLSGFESGADDYVPKPANPREVIARVRALVGRVQRARGITAPVILFIGAKGGVGNTTVALNAALALATPDRRVILLEIGGLALTTTWLLSLRPTQDLGSLTVPEGSWLSMAVLQPAILLHSSGLHYLPVLLGEGAETRLRPGLLVEALGLLQSNYDVVIIDMGLGALLLTGEALSFVTHLIPVAVPERVCLRHLQELLEWLRQHKLESRVPGFVLVERGDTGGVRASSAINPTSLGILAVIPSAAAVLAEADARRQPLYLVAPDSPASLAIAEFAGRLIGNPPAPLAPGQATKTDS